MMILTVNSFINILFLAKYTLLFYNSGSKVSEEVRIKQKRRKRVQCMWIGLIIGIVSGAVQFLMLAKFTSSVTGESFSKKTAFFAVFQFVLPIIVLVGCALLIEGSLLWSAIGMTATLMLCAFIRFILSNKKTSGR